MTSENFHFTFKIHVVEGKTQVLLFLLRLRELSMSCFLILKFRLFRVTNSSHKVAKLVRNEKRFLIEGEVNICQTRAGLFVFIVISQKRKLLNKTRR